MRGKNITELLRVFCGSAERIKNEFDVESDNLLYKTKANASTISLEHHIKRELDVDVVITSLNGYPYDFLVNVYGFADERRLKSIIDQYKLAGKSYLFRIGTVAYTAEFTNHVCEDIIELFEAEWIENVCETDGIVLLTPTLDFEGNNFTIAVNVLYRVKSDVTFDATVLFYDSSNTLINSQLITLTLLTDTYNVNKNDGVISGGSAATGKIYINNIRPTSDEYYHYVANNSN